MTAVEYISDTEEIVKASWSLFQHDGVAAFKLVQKSPVPPAWSAKNRPGGRTHILNVCQIKWIDRHPAETDEDSSPESISDTENSPNWNEDLDNPNMSEDNWEAHNESDMELDNGSENSETPEQRNVSVAPNVPGLIRRIRRSKRKVEKTLMMVNIMEPGGIRGSSRSRTEYVNVLWPSSLCSVLKISFREILWKNIEQSHEKICWYTQVYQAICTVWQHL